jgi:hypothetical protein
MRHVTSSGVRRKLGRISALAGLMAAMALHTARADHCHADEVLLGSRVETLQNTVYQVDTCMKGSGPWTRGELDVFNRVLTSLPDTPERRWVMGHVALIRRHVPGDSPIWAGRADNGSAALIVNDEFFSETSAAARRTLVAFESGKAFYVRYELESWDARHMQDFRQAMMNMISAGKAADERNADMYDRTSQFGGVFRVRMLQLPPKPEWLGALRELDKLVDRYASPDAERVKGSP